MPVMQFSDAPWRVLNCEQLAHIKAAVALCEKYLPVLRQIWMHCARTVEPILRPMAYSFPDELCVGCMDQFMLGDTLLVAPVLQRKVYFPKGTGCSQESRFIPMVCTRTRLADITACFSKAYCIDTFLDKW